MKTLPSLVSIGCLWFASLIAVSADNQTNREIPAIGIYDSRAVAYAHFCREPCQKRLPEQVTAAKAAKQAGENAKYQNHAAALRAEQDQNHRQVFSTAPVDEAMAAIKDRIPEIQNQAGVSVLVSKWDETTLLKYEGVTRIDVTDKLVREFIQPTEKQQKTISGIEKSVPLSLEKCDELIRKGKI